MMPRLLFGRLEGYRRVTGRERNKGRKKGVIPSGVGERLNGPGSGGNEKRNIMTFLLSPLTRHCLAGQEARRPGGLEVEAARDAINIQHFSGEIEARHPAALHGFEVDFAE